MFKGKKRICAGNSQEFTGFGRTPGRCAPGLAEHEIGCCLMAIEPSYAWDDVIVAVENQKEIRGLDIASIHMTCNVFHPHNRPSVLGITGVIEIQLAGFVLRDIFEISPSRSHRTVYGGLVVGIQTERFGKTTVFGSVYLSARHQSNEVVLHRRGIVLLRKCSSRLPSPGQPNNQPNSIAVGDGNDFAARVQRQSSPVIDDLIPHSQAALFRLSKIVAVEYPCDSLFEINRNQAVGWIAGHWEVWCVDDRKARLKLS